ncbi:MAG: DNA primase [Candidatus Thermoplasmatota archaeon]|nr:DNA primase [Candidatus Thermoplasmatota archaeon]
MEQIEKVLSQLQDLSETTPIIVEGLRDIAALKRMGITRNVISLGKGDSIFNFSENLSRTTRRAIILTDWDRKGGQLARMLREALMANGVIANDNIRAKLGILSKKEVKDIESMPAFVERLRYRPRSSIRKARAG